jgi:hypothetical protein
MKINRRLPLILALVATGVACEKKPQKVDSGTDDAKLRPEVAVARQGASPTPTLDEARTSPSPSP